MENNKWQEHQSQTKGDVLLIIVGMVVYRGKPILLPQQEVAQFITPFDSAFKKTTV